MARAVSQGQQDIIPYSRGTSDQGVRINARECGKLSRVEVLVVWTFLKADSNRLSCRWPGNQEEDPDWRKSAVSTSVRDYGSLYQEACSAIIHELNNPYSTVKEIGSRS